MSKESAYDAEIFPLMEQIIAICEKHKIAHLCHFELDGEGDDQCLCTTCNTSDDSKPTKQIREAVKAVYPPGRIVAFAITVKERVE